MFENFRKLLSRPDPLAATAAKGALPSAPLPKARPGQGSFPGYVTSQQVSTSAIQLTDLQTANSDLVGTYRLGANTPTVIRNLAQVHPDLAAAVSAHLRIGIPEKYIAIATSPDGNFNLEGTQLVAELLRRWSSLPNYDAGFSQTDSLRSVAEACGKEGVLYGGMMLELVLDKQRLPSELQPIPITQVKFYEDAKGLRPVQVVGGQDVDLDFPTVFYVTLDPSLLTPYPQSPIESSIQPALASAKFLQDLRRLCERHIYPRYDIAIDEEKLRKNLPQEIEGDQEKVDAYLNEVFASASDMVTNLGVEEACVHYDFIVVKYVEGQGGDVPQVFETVKSIHDAKMATGAKSMPAILGHGTGSQNTASTETLIAMMTANSMVRLKLQELFSRALTMACRVMGLDVTVAFEYDTIDLRPATELEAFKAMYQSRILEQLSLGMMGDEEACLRLTGKLPPAGYVPKTGTGFHKAASPNGNPYSGSGVGGGQSGGGAANQSLATQTPTNPKSK